MELSDEAMNRILTLSPEEQTKLVLEGKCPHNKGWRYVGHGHNDDAYECKLCRDINFW